MNQDELDSHCLLIGTKNADFYLQCISNAKKLFYETAPPKNHDQLCLEIKGYQDALIVSFTANTPAITTATHTGEEYILHNQM